MSILNTYSKQPQERTFKCDGCGTTISVMVGTWAYVGNDLRAKGWSAIPKNMRYEHACPDCVAIMREGVSLFDIKKARLLKQVKGEE